MKFLNTYNRRDARDQVLNDTAPLLRGQARIVLRYSMTSATTLSDVLRHITTSVLSV